MALVEIPWNPSDRQLRQFGVVALVALPAAGWLATRDGAIAGCLAACGVLFVVLGVVFPRALKFPFLALCLVTLPIGLVMSELALLAIWWLVMTPIGLCFKLLGRDAMTRKLDRQAASYWTAKAQPKGPRDYFHQS